MLPGLGMENIVPSGAEQLQESRGNYPFQDTFGAMKMVNIFEAIKAIPHADLLPVSISRTRIFGHSDGRDVRTPPAAPGRDQVREISKCRTNILYLIQ